MAKIEPLTAADPGSGPPQLKPEPGIVRIMLRDVLNLPQLLTYLSTFLTILRSPTQRTLALTNDEAFDDHASFLAIGMAFFLTMMGLSGALSDNAMLTWAMTKPALDVYARIRDWMTSIQYTLIFLTAIPISYELFRWHSKIPLSQQRFVKCVCLANGFVAPLLVLAAVPYAVSIRSNLDDMTPARIAGVIVGLVLYSAITIASLIYTYRVNKVLWQTSTAWTIGLLVASQLLSLILTTLLMLALTLLLDLAAPLFA